MKKIVFSSGVITLLFVTMMFSSCKKFIDKYFPHPPGGGGGESSCQIATIVQGPRSGVVYYNSHGNPDSVIFDEGYGAAKNYYFMYDASHRLIGYEADYDYDPGNYYYIHKYTYDGNHISVDSAWIREAGEYAQVTYPEYDGVGRVISDTGHIFMSDGNPADSPTGGEFDYGSDGNLQTGYSYDDKTSYISTNSVWQFVEKNYSKNNPVGATGYNANGLPLGFGSTYSSGFLQFGHPDVITYNCD